VSAQIQDSNGSGLKVRVALMELGNLPPTLRPEEAFGLLGVGRTAGYELIRKDELPALRLGGKLLVPTAALLRLIGWD
jgi:excisionase family DNA binding protein